MADDAQMPEAEAIATLCALTGVAPAQAATLVRTRHPAARPNQKNCTDGSRTDPPALICMRSCKMRVGTCSWR